MSYEFLACDFAKEALELLDDLEQRLLCLETSSGEQRGQLVAAAKRTLHTLKGNSGLVGARALQSAFHVMEDLAAGLGEDPRAVGGLLRGLDLVRVETRAIAEGRSVDAPDKALLRFTLGEDEAITGVEPTYVEQSDELRLPQARVDELVATAGDLVVQNLRLQRLVLGADRVELRTWRETADRLDASVRRLHEQLLRVRMVPAGRLLSRFQRLVRDEALRHEKTVAVRVVGEEIPVDKVVLDYLAKALIHLVRNAVAHGIETPQTRREAGKSPEGTITLSAVQFGDRIEIAVGDDGRGLDHEAIVRRALDLGLDPKLGDSTLVFEPGFSTAALTESAGRGIGLDAVKRVVYGIGGTIELSSNPGMGTRFSMRVPASIALQRALLCEVNGETYAVPVASVLEATRLDEGRIRWLGSGAAVEHRGSLVPLVDSRQVLGAPESDGCYAVILQADGLAALRVEALLGQQDFVFQPIDATLRGRAPISAGALLADGRVVLRLDPDSLVAATAKARRPEVRS